MKGPKRRKERKSILTKPRYYLEAIQVEVKGKEGARKERRKLLVCKATGMQSKGRQRRQKRD
jgi:hypothetical protein